MYMCPHGNSQSFGTCCFISTVAGTDYTVAGTDYVAQSVNLTFSHGDMEICHTVDILQDDECESMPENFFSDLEYVSGIQTIDIMPDTTEVFIDDSNEPECGECRINCRSKVNHVYTYQVISLNCKCKRFLISPQLILLLGMRRQSTPHQKGTPL